jgi:hypothetical protein
MVFIMTGLRELSQLPYSGPNPFATPWTLRHDEIPGFHRLGHPVIQRAHVVCAAGFSIGSLNIENDYYLVTGPLINGAMNERPPHMPLLRRLLPEISGPWEFRLAPNHPTRPLPPQIQLVDQNSQIVVFTSAYLRRDIDNKEFIRIFGEYVAHKCNTVLELVRNERAPADAAVRNDPQVAVAPRELSKA